MEERLVRIENLIMDMKADTAVTKSLVDTQNQKIDNVCESLKSQNKRILSLEGTRNRGIGFIAGSGLFGGSIGAWLAKFLG